MGQSVSTIVFFGVCIFLLRIKRLNVVRIVGEAWKFCATKHLISKHNYNFNMFTMFINIGNKTELSLIGQNREADASRFCPMYVVARYVDK